MSLKTSGFKASKEKLKIETKIYKPMSFTTVQSVRNSSSTFGSSPKRIKIISTPTNIFASKLKIETDEGLLSSKPTATKIPF